MLAHFISRDATALLAVAGQHLDHLDSSIAALPADTGLFTASLPAQGDGRGPDGRGRRDGRGPDGRSG
jgi:hypothetical protein